MSINRTEEAAWLAFEIVSAMRDIGDSDDLTSLVKKSITRGPGFQREVLNHLDKKTASFVANMAVRIIREHANRRSPERNFERLHGLDEEQADIAAQLLNQDSYNKLTKYAFKQPDNAHVLAALVEQPTQFAAYAVREGLDMRESRQVYKVMDDEQKALFLQLISNYFDAYGPEEEGGQKIAQMVGNLIRNIMSNEFAQSFNYEVAEDRQALMMELVRWPDAIGECIVNHNLWERTEMLEAFLGQMGEGQRTTMQDVMADRLRDFSPEHIKTLIGTQLKLSRGVVQEMLEEVGTRLGQRG